MEENAKSSTANLTAANQILEKTIEENAALINRLQDIADKIGRINELPKEANLQLSPEVNGEFIIAKTFQNIRKLSDLNTLFHHLITNLERMIA